jgi:hypothetical protein
VCIVTGLFPCHAIVSGLISRAAQLFLEIKLRSGDDAAILRQHVLTCERHPGTTHVVFNGLQKTVWKL